jgi:hypothetical protein
VGQVLAIEDVNPESLSGHSESHSFREPLPVDDPGAIDPGAITIGAAVNVLYELVQRR